MKNDYTHGSAKSPQPSATWRISCTRKYSRWQVALDPAYCCMLARRALPTPLPGDDPTGRGRQAQGVKAGQRQQAKVPFLRALSAHAAAHSGRSAGAVR